MKQFAFRLEPGAREPFDQAHVSQMPHTSGVYVIFDLAGPVYAGRSKNDIQRRLYRHLVGSGNKNIALASRVGAAQSLTFTYCCLPPSEQADVERMLIAVLGVAKFANLRREGLYEEDLT
jgi:hypothetical protein